MFDPRADTVCRYRASVAHISRFGSEVVVVQSEIRVFIVADVRFYRDGLADVIARHPRCIVLGTASTRRDAVEHVREDVPDIVLLDAAMPEGLATAAEIASCAPSVRVVAIALDETPHAVLEWAEEGVSGYVARDASLAD